MLRLQGGTIKQYAVVDVEIFPNSSDGSARTLIQFFITIVGDVMDLDFSTTYRIFFQSSTAIELYYKGSQE
jgi:hypothetical protein